MNQPIDDEGSNKGFECLGYVVYCDNCGRRYNLPAANTIAEAKEDARKKGMVLKEGKHFCNDDCRREHEGEICLHAWARSGPKAFECIKCGIHRDDINKLEEQ